MTKQQFAKQTTLLTLLLCLKVIILIPLVGRLAAIYGHEKILGMLLVYGLPIAAVLWIALAMAQRLRHRLVPAPALVETRSPGTHD